MFGIVSCRECPLFHYRNLTSGCRNDGRESLREFSEEEQGGAVVYPNEPPSWCPLRQGDITFTLQEPDTDDDLLRDTGDATQERGAAVA